MTSSAARHAEDGRGDALGGGYGPAAAAAASSAGRRGIGRADALLASPNGQEPLGAALGRGAIPAVVDATARARRSGADSVVEPTAEERAPEAALAAATAAALPRRAALTRFRSRRIIRCATSATDRPAKVWVGGTGWPGHATGWSPRAPLEESGASESAVEASGGRSASRSPRPPAGSAPSRFARRVLTSSGSDLSIISLSIDSNAST